MTENDSSQYREAMKRLVSLMLENRSSFAQFAMAAEKEGLREAAGVLSAMEKEELSQLSRFGKYGDTISNLRLMIERQMSKCRAVTSLIELAERVGDVDTLGEFRIILMEERGKVDRLRKNLDFMERHAEKIKELRKKEEERKREEQEQKKRDEAEPDVEMTEMDIRDWY